MCKDRKVVSLVILIYHITFLYRIFFYYFPINNKVIKILLLMVRTDINYICLLICKNRFAPTIFLLLKNTGISPLHLRKNYNIFHTNIWTWVVRFRKIVKLNFFTLFKSR